MTGYKTWLGVLVAFGPKLVSDVTEALSAGGVSVGKFVEIAGYTLMIIGVVHKILRQVTGDPS